MRALKVFYTEGKITFIYILFFPFLFVLSVLYIFCVYLIKLFYKVGLLKSCRPRCAVISVGNITLGGSGKTPLVEYLASKLVREGRKVSVLLKGYKRPCRIEYPGKSDYLNLGDEASMLKNNLPDSVIVMAGSNRCRLAEEIDASGEDRIIILDDGFQHWRLKRDLDIVAVDARNPFGNGFVIPAGRLREDISSLRRADIFCLTHCDEVVAENIEYVKRRLVGINRSAPIIEAVHSPRGIHKLGRKEEEEMSVIKNKKFCLLCGIANPSSFIHLVKKLGAVVVSKAIFDDHHHYTEDDINRLQDSCKSCGADAIITTQKDEERLKDRGLFKSTAEIFVLKIAMDITSGKRELDERLSSLRNTQD